MGRRYVFLGPHMTRQRNQGIGGIGVMGTSGPVRCPLWSLCPPTGPQ